MENLSFSLELAKKNNCVIISIQEYRTYRVVPPRRLCEYKISQSFKSLIINNGNNNKYNNGNKQRLQALIGRRSRNAIILITTEKAPPLLPSDSRQEIE